MTRQDYEDARKRILEYYEKANIVMSEEEKENVEVADFGLGDFETIGLGVVTYVNTKRCCAKELVLFPGQICPEHIHVAVPELNYEGKEETFRCRYGTVYLFVEGEATPEIHATIPEKYKDTFTIYHEIVLHPGDQYTLHPNTKHWFQGGEEGAVVSEFSTMSLDEYDLFTDENIKRIPEIDD